MRISLRTFTIAALLLIVFGSAACGDDDSMRSSRSDAEPRDQVAPASAIAPAPDSPSTSFDPALLFGDWDTSIDDPENGLRLDLKVNYEQDAFSIHGTVTMTDPNLQDDESLKNFVVTGIWTLEGNTLIETAKKSTFPLWRVGVASPATIKRLDDSTFAFERSGALMTFTRI